MLVEKEIGTSHDDNALKEILSDPSFVLPKLFPPIKKVITENNTFHCDGIFVGMKFEMTGNIYKSNNIIRFVFSLKSGSAKGDGKLEITINDKVLKLVFSYEGWMNRFSKIFFMSKWFNNFAKNLNDEVRLERIRRKI
ncbi:DUF3211 domain-containing protein [Acidianus sulfidivorans JP7]|uniref:DUF3211 domain-containing protein n=1 Tax=Acidianus sulfidivorans JP7 TaxID=619593 RepID=A0A2U9IJS4_9CREN|nr:DUF3211 domain-containing protein [Acidianus sulfidivorans]AWR96282.1 DUF3211 domain-containing protein [Acidianus sulfidivorans JP7]